MKTTLLLLYCVALSTASVLRPEKHRSKNGLSFSSSETSGNWKLFEPNNVNQQSGLLLNFLPSNSSEDVTERIYKYSTEVDLDNNLSQASLSAFWVEGILSVKSCRDTTVFKFLNLESSVCKGLCYANSEDKQSSVQALLSDLYVPFSIKKDGQKYFLFSENDSKWTRNIKRGIASLFDLENTKPKDSQEYGKSVSVDELTVNGKCPVQYFWEQNNSSEDFIMRKHYNLALCQKKESMNNARKFMRNSFQSTNHYHLISKNGHVTMLAAKSEGNYKEFNSNQGTDLQTKQNVKLISVKTHNSADCSVGPTKMIEHAFEFESSKSDLGSVDFQNSVSSPSHLSDSVQKNFDELVRYFGYGQLKMDQSHIQKSRIIKRTLTLMKQIEKNGFEHLYSQLSANKDKRFIFLSLMSYIGTDASAMFMCQLYHNGLLESQLYAKYLIEMPAYYDNPTEKSLEAWSECHRSAVNSGKVVGNVAQANKAFNLAFGVVFNQLYREQIETLAVDPQQTSDNSFLYRVIRNAFTKFDNAQTTEEQADALDVVKNVAAGSPMLLNFFNKKIVHNKALPLEVRLSAFRLPQRKTVDSEYSSKVYSVYSPILKDESEMLAFRATALNVIMENSYGSYQMLYSYISNLKSPSHLYNYFHSFVKQQSSSANVNAEILRKFQSDFKLRDVENKQLATFVKTLTSYVDDSNRGREIIVKCIADQKTTLPHLLQLQVNSIHPQGVTNEYTINVEVNDVDKYMLSNMFKKLRAELTVESISELLASFEMKTDASINIVMEKYGYVVMRMSHKLNSNLPAQQSLVSKITEVLGMRAEEYYEDCSGLPDVISKGRKMCGKSSIHKKIGSMDIEENVFVTDNGFMATHSYFTPSYHYATRNHSLAMNSGINLNFLSSVWYAKQSELSVFNPFIEAWTGKGKLQSTMLQIPFNLEGLIMNFGQTKKIFFNAPLNDGEHFGFEAKTDVYNFTDSLASNDNSRLSGEMLRQYSVDEKPSSSNNFNFHREMFGMDMQFGGNMDSCTPFHSLMERKSSIPSTLFEMKDVYFGHTLPKMCDMKFKIQPSQSSTKISVDLKVKGKYTDSHPLPGKQVNIQGRVSLLGESSNPSRSFSFDTDYSGSANDVSTVVNTKVKSFTDGQDDANDFTIAYSKEYPALGKDSFVYGWGNEKVSTKMSFSCSSGNCMRFSVAAVGEISDEQKQEADSDSYPNSQCQVDKQKPEWQGELYPRTWACFERAIRLFYARKVSLSANYQNVPESLKTFVAVALNGANKYLSNYVQTSAKTTQEGSFQAVVQFSARQPKVDIDMTTSVGTFNYKNVPAINTDFFNLQIDNTHFSRFLSILQSTGFAPSCIVNANSVMTRDNSTVSHALSSSYEVISSTKNNKLTGLAKKTPSGVAVKVVAGDVSLEITPSGASLNGKAIPNLENGYEYPPGEPYYLFRIWKHEGQVTVYSNTLYLYLIYSPQSITFDLPIFYLGQLGGLCGGLYA